MVGIALEMSYLISDYMHWNAASCLTVSSYLLSRA